MRARCARCDRPSGCAPIRGSRPGYRRGTTPLSWRSRKTVRNSPPSHPRSRLVETGFQSTPPSSCFTPCTFHFAAEENEGAWSDLQHAVRVQRPRQRAPLPLPPLFGRIDNFPPPFGAERKLARFGRSAEIIKDEDLIDTRPAPDEQQAFLLPGDNINRIFVERREARRLLTETNELAV